MSFCPTFCLSNSLSVTVSLAEHLSVCQSFSQYTVCWSVCQFSVCLTVSVHLNYLSVSPVCPVVCCFVSLSVCSDKDCDNVIKKFTTKGHTSKFILCFVGLVGEHTHTHQHSSSSSSRQSCLRVLKSFC